MRTEKKKQVKIKPKFNLKGIPAPYKWIAEIAITHASTQTQCEELFLVGVKALDEQAETISADDLKKAEKQIVTQAILQKVEFSKEII
jgi:hypothetical protein